MSNCHVKLQSQLIRTAWVFILLNDAILATKETSCYLSDNERSKRGATKDEALLFEELNPNVAEGMSQVAQTRERQERNINKLNSVGSENNAVLNDNAEQEGDDTDDKGVLSRSVSDRNTRRRSKSRSGPKMWDHWGKWTSCSVSCGVGKMTRWRHCVSGSCAAGEKEAQIKTCSLAAC